MDTETWIALAVVALFPLTIVAERLWPARQFPTIPWWNTLGIALFFYIGAIATVVQEALPPEWLAAHKLFDLSPLGLLPGVLIGYLLTTLAMYGWHRATHEINILWRVFHQLHHAPRHLNVYVQGFNHPLDISIYMAVPFVMSLFVLGVDPLAAVIIANLGGVSAFLQHANLRTPRWLAVVLQRPEAHCIHHQRGLHRYNYSDLPLWDVLFGTFRNPDTWEGETGFDEPADQRYLAMLAFVDVNAPLIGERSLGQSGQPDEGQTA